MLNAEDTDLYHPGESFRNRAVMGLIENLDPPARQVLAAVRRQLISIRKDIDKADGIVKTFLPDGRLEIKDADGNRFVRPPYSWEIEGN